MATATLTEQQLRLGKVLMAAGPVTHEFLKQELESSGKAASALGRALGQSGFVTEAELARTLIARHRIPKINLKNTNIPLKTIAVLTPETASECRALPIDRIGKVLVIVTPDIFNADAIQRLRDMTGFHVSIIQCAAEGFDQILSDYYGRLAEKPEIAREVQAEIGRSMPGAAAARPAGGGGAPGRLSAIAANEDELKKAVALEGYHMDLAARWDHLFASDGPVEAEEILL